MKNYANLRITLNLWKDFTEESLECFITARYEWADALVEMKRAAKYKSAPWEEPQWQRLQSAEEAVAIARQTLESDKKTMKDVGEHKENLQLEISTLFNDIMNEKHFQNSTPNVRKVKEDAKALMKKFYEDELAELNTPSNYLDTLRRIDFELSSFASQRAENDAELEQRVRDAIKEDERMKNEDQW